jgi:membrane protein DedA with SNARE-associated domain/rhodanese-related sulfurtransferase
MIGSFTQPGYALLFFWVLIEQAGMPIPAIPVLLAAGTMAANGTMRFSGGILIAVLAAMIADAGWYEAGRRRGISLIHSLCRISLEKDSCARRTEMLYGRYGGFALVLAKFIPGLNFAAPPLSGVFHMRRRRFLAFSAAGAAAWVLVYMGLGFIFSAQLNRVVRLLNSAGHSFVVALVIFVLIGFAARKYRSRRRFLAQLRAARIGVYDLKEEMDRTVVVILDVRHPLDVLATPFIIKNALRFPLERMTSHPPQLPLETNIVIYCTCPNEASSARAFQLLQKQGFGRVRVLAGGFQAWRDNGFEVQNFPFAGQELQLSRPIWAF